METDLTKSKAPTRFEDMGMKPHVWLVLLTLALSACGINKSGHDFSTLLKGNEPTPISDQNKVLQIALSLQGAPYLYGGATPQGFDCTGFVKYVFKKSLDIQLPRKSRDQIRSGTSVEVKDLRVADLVYFTVEGEESLHMGIYIGNGDFIHAPSSNGVVHIQSLGEKFWQDRYRGARRVISLQA